MLTRSNTRKYVKNSTEGSWIYLQCLKFGRVTFGKESLQNMFSSNDKNLLRQIKNFCFEKRIKVQADKTKSLFTFEIPRKKSIAGLVSWVH